MKKFFKMMMMLLVAGILVLGVTACKKEEKKVENATATTEEGDPEYNVEDDLVEGILTDEMLDEMIAEEEAAAATAEEGDETEEATPAKLNKYALQINRNTNVVTVFTHDDNGNYNIPIKAFICATGLNNGTPLGTYKISSKHRWQLMYGGSYAQYCSRITGHILFHSITYGEPKSDKMYTNPYNGLGQQGSAGCVRLRCGDAYWIYSNCPSGTVVNIIHGTSADDPLGKPSYAKISLSSPYRSWDPTDPDPNNPWKTVKPTITVADRTVELGSNVNLLEGISAIDADGDVVTPTTSGDFDANRPGAYKITYTATDARGNSASASNTITVVDTTKPSIDISQVNGIQYTDELSVGAAQAFVQGRVSASDASGTANISVTVNAFAESSGSISGTVSATDSSNNTETVGFTMSFVVPDRTGPSINIGVVNGKTYNPSSVPTVQTAQDYVKNQITPHVSDSSGIISSITVFIPSITQTNNYSGSFSGTVTAVDGNNNSTTSNFTMSYVVPDTTKPTVTVDSSVVDNSTYTVSSLEASEDENNKATVQSFIAKKITVRDDRDNGITPTINVEIVRDATAKTYAKITITAKDAAGNNSDAKVITLELVK